MHRVILAMAVALAAASAHAQQPSDAGPDASAVRQTVSDYALGVQAADAERLARAIHPELTSVLLTSYPQTGRPVLKTSGASYLVEIARARGGFVEEAQRRADVVVYDAGHGIAAAKLTSARAVSHLQLARIEGVWRIVNVLRAPAVGDAGGRAAADAETEAAIRQTALDYIDGSYSGDAVRMTRALHPELTKVLLTRHPQSGREFLVHMGATDLIEGTRAQLGLLEESARQIEVTVFDVGGGLASVKVVSASYIDYVQMANLGDRWQIVNVLWVPNPSAPAR